MNRWNAYWFPTTTTLNLACCRIIAVAAQLLWFFPSLDTHIGLLEGNPEFIDPQLLIRAITAIVPREMLFTPPAFTALYRATALAGVAALVGLFTRASMFLFALGIWIIIAHEYSYSDLHHPEAVFAIFLMALAFSPSGESLSLDALIRRWRGRAARNTTGASGLVDTAMWPLKLAHVLLAMTYFSTGATKVIAGRGLGWMNGYTLQGYTFADALNRNLPLGIWVAQHHTLSVLLSVYAVLFELLFFLSLILPRTAPFFFVNGLLFQIGLYLTGGHFFVQHMVLLVLLLVFLDPDWWRPWVKQHLGGQLPWRRIQERAHQPP